MLWGRKALAWWSSCGRLDTRAERHKQKPGYVWGQDVARTQWGLSRAEAGMGQRKMEAQQVCEGEQCWRGCLVCLASGQHTPFSFPFQSLQRGLHVPVVHGYPSSPAHAGAQRRLSCLNPCRRDRVLFHQRPSAQTTTGRCRCFWALALPSVRPLCLLQARLFFQSRIGCCASMVAPVSASCFLSLLTQCLGLRYPGTQVPRSSCSFSLGYPVFSCF